MNNTNDLLRRMIAAADNVMRNWSKGDLAGAVNDLESVADEAREALPLPVNKIRFIVETYSSRRDTSGNVYHCAVITSTLTGNSQYLKDTGGSTGAEWILRNNLKVDWLEMYTTHIENMPKREWQRHRANKSGKYPHEVTVDMLRALEVA